MSGAKELNEEEVSYSTIVEVSLIDTEMGLDLDFEGSHAPEHKTSVDSIRNMDAFNGKRQPLDNNHLPAKSTETGTQ